MREGCSGRGMRPQPAVSSSADQTVQIGEAKEVDAADDVEGIARGDGIEPSGPKSALPGIGCVVAGRDRAARPSRWESGPAPWRVRRREAGRRARVSPWKSGLVQQRLGIRKGGGGARDMRKEAPLLIQQNALRAFEHGVLAQRSSPGSPRPGTIRMRWANSRVECCQIVEIGRRELGSQLSVSALSMSRHGFEAALQHELEFLPKHGRTGADLRRRSPARRTPRRRPASGRSPARTSHAVPAPRSISRMRLARMLAGVNDRRPRADA